MPLSLLVSNQINLTLMEIYDDKSTLSYIENDKNLENNIEKIEEKVLCVHCLRTSSNGIRCMGICVADNDY